ncbi:MAG TPA: zinc-ribbon domain-containing protein, partial [Magnetospirillum sp.]|nr:zinc-ribbon domain-containing protein [Magnetospirillum sp.]
MLISCPNCATNFSVPDKALGQSGRTLKCAKCGHKWFQSPARIDHDFGLDEGSFPPPPAPSRPEPRPEPRPMFKAPKPETDLPEPDLDDEPVFRAPPPGSRPPADEDMDLDEPPLPDFGPRARADRPAAGTDLDLDGPPQPIPDVFNTEPRT